MAWRNIWRNTRRTVLTAAALGLGVAALVFSHSFAETMYGTMIELATRGLLGHMQIHGKGYNDEPDLYTVVAAPAETERAVGEVLVGATVLHRVTGYGMAASEERSGGVAVIGVQPHKEQSRTKLIQIAKGRGLAAQPKHEILVGASLAKRLRAEIGSEMVLIGQAADGSMANDIYKIVGLTSGGGSAELGDASVFLHLADAQEFFSLGEGVHALVINLNNGMAPKKAAAKLRAAKNPTTGKPVIDQEVLEALSWNEMMPEIEIGIEADRQGTFGLDFVVFLIVVLGIFNTMTMATYERIRELGILRSLGTRGRRVMALIVTESLMIGLVSLVTGLALAAGIIMSIGTLDISSMGGGDFMGVSMPTVIELEVKPLAITMAVVTVFFTCFFGGLYPAWKAARLSPVEAVRHI